MRFQQVYDYIEANKPEVILETGTWSGDNAIHMLKDGAKKYIGFDLWEDGDESLDEMENNVKKRITLDEVKKKLEKYDVELIKGNTRETLKAYIAGKKPFVDMALIDGGHSEGTIKNDLLNLLRIVKSNGVIFMDDYYFECPTPNVGAQSVLKSINIPYVVLPKVDKAKGGYAIKMVRIDMKNVPRQDWDIPEERSWQYKVA